MPTTPMRLMIQQFIRPAASGLVNFFLACEVWFEALRLFNIAVLNTPAQALPTFQTLPYLGSGYLLLGLVSAIWTSHGALTWVPTLLAFFLALGGAHFGADYYPETVWDHLGRPTVQNAAVGFICAGASCLGWYCGQRFKMLWRNRGSRLTSARADGVPKEGAR